MIYNRLGLLIVIVSLLAGCTSNQFSNVQVGLDQTVDQGENVTLHGSASDPDGTVRGDHIAKPSFPMPEMVTIPAGSFLMGCVSGIYCEDNEKPVHIVRIESFELSKYEVTFEEYDAFTDATGRERVDDEGWGRGKRPVINVSWHDAVAYTQWLSSQTGERYRLPSEAEWEYAARAGTETEYSWGNEIGVNLANCFDCGSQWDGDKTAPVGSFRSNRWGLYDMHGNVWEWVQDCYNSSYKGAPGDGSAWESGDCSYRVLRGGSWYYFPWTLRSALRFWFTAEDQSNYLFGFRVARSF